MSDQQDQQSSGNRWESAPTGTGGTATLESERLDAAPATPTEPPTPTTSGRLRKHRWTAGAGVAGLVLGGAVGFGLGHATAGNDTTRGGFGPGRGGQGFGPGQNGQGGPGGFGPGQQQGQQQGQVPNQQSQQGQTS